MVAIVTMVMMRRALPTAELSIVYAHLCVAKVPMNGRYSRPSFFLHRHQPSREPHQAS